MLDAAERTDAAVVDWLLASKEPAIRRLARRDLLDEPAPDDEANLLNGPIVRMLLDGQQPNGGFGGHPYNKWGGAHWRLVSLVELGIPAGEPRALAAANTVLAWLSAASHRRNVPVIEGLARRCGSQEGNALAVASRLGMAGDERVRLLASSLVEWQWPDGGWNCDQRPEAHRSSFTRACPPSGASTSTPLRPEIPMQRRPPAAVPNSCSSIGSSAACPPPSRSMPSG